MTGLVLVLSREFFFLSQVECKTIEVEVVAETGSIVRVSGAVSLCGEELTGNGAEDSERIVLPSDVASSSSQGRPPSLQTDDPQGRAAPSAPWYNRRSREGHGFMI